MKLYLDVLFLLNMGFDFLLLITVSYILHRQASIKRLLLGSFFGGSTIFLLFFPLTNITLFLFKFIVSVFMILLTFSYRDFRYTMKNLGYLYMTSIVLGGFMYFLNTEFSYKQEGLVFYYEGLSINFIVLIIASPIILYLYVRQLRWLKQNQNYYHSVEVRFDHHIIKGVGFVDTGSNITDPYLKRPVLVLDKRKFIYDLNRFKMVLIPITTATGTTLMKCFTPSEVTIDEQPLKKSVLIGFLDEKLLLDGVDIILSLKIMEDL